MQAALAEDLRIIRKQLPDAASVDMVIGDPYAGDMDDLNLVTYFYTEARDASGNVVGVSDQVEDQPAGITEFWSPGDYLSPWLSQTFLESYLPNVPGVSATTTGDKLVIAIDEVLNA